VTVAGMADFAASYDRQFAVVRADTQALLDLAYSLRYQVYCLENQFEDPAQFSDGREIDGDDDRSVHTLLVQRATGAVAGTVRVILPCHDAARQLPIERVLNVRDRLLFQCFPLRSTAEISRFAVSKEYRRRHGEQRYADAKFSEPRDGLLPKERRLMPHITFGLLRGVLDICLNYGVTHLAGVVEPALIRILAGFGLDFEPLGSPVEHHGIRQPCVARLVDLIQRSRERTTPLWQYLKADILGLDARPVDRALDRRVGREPSNREQLHQFRRRPAL
jgi:N-acyl amino acid synthase of PEP-CTERM/exosortase system